MRNLELSQETAKRWYEGTDEELKALALQTYPELAKKELPKSWEELGKIKGYFVSTMATINKLEKHSKGLENVFATKEQAEASIVLAQLSQLREVYRNGWKPNWNERVDKYCIILGNTKITKSTAWENDKFLSFQDAETRDLFLENFRDLIEKAKPLMS